MTRQRDLQTLNSLRVNLEQTIDRLCLIPFKDEANEADADLAVDHVTAALDILLTLLKAKENEDESD